MYKCNYCDGEWNYEDKCFKKKKDEEKKKRISKICGDDSRTDVSIVAIDNDVLVSELDSNNNSWILDSGATAHMCNNKSYMYDIEPSYCKVSFGSKDSVSNGEWTSKIDVEITNFNGKKCLWLLKMWFMLEISGEI